VLEALGRVLRRDDADGSPDVSVHYEVPRAAEGGYSPVPPRRRRRRSTTPTDDDTEDGLAWDYSDTHSLEYSDEVWKK